MHVSRLLVFTFPIALQVLCLAQGGKENNPISGFTGNDVTAERVLEQKYRALPDPKRIADNLLQLAAHPHNVGSEAQRKNADWLVARYKEWGWDAHIERFDVLYPTPTVRVLELTGPTKFKAKLEEPPLPGDPYTKEKKTQLPGFNIYSADGDVTGQLVYANYGLPADYDELARNGVDVKGKIVITRYGGGWRGLKPKLAYEHGAVGCLIYSDPADDGYGQGDVLPKGPMRPPDGIQRGSVADMTLYSGDPLTPGIASVPGAKRLSLTEATTLMRIPVLPISYSDAQPLLAALSGRTVPSAWRGALPLTYHYGPGPATVHLQLKFDWSQKPVLDVIATMKGAEEPDVWIVRGNHYDGWVNGADDPISGQSALLEEARALGELAKGGWRPKRTLVYAAWDGEEPGLIGSTEWVEAHADELDKKAAVYINTDDSGRGFFQAGGSHSLEAMVNEVVKGIEDPETGVSVWKRAQAMRVSSYGHHSRGTKNAMHADAESFPPVLPLEAIGSGSDFGAFLDHVGIASVNLGFGGEDRSGTYHSAYDTPWFHQHFGDKHEVYGKLLAQTAGTLVLRFADAPLLPLRFSNLAATVKMYVGELKGELKSLQSSALAQKEQLTLDIPKLVNDPQTPLQAARTLVSPPEMDFSALDRSVDDLAAAAGKLDGVLAKANSLTAEQATMINAELATTERKLISTAGLPGRSWMRHLLYAPGTYSGYGAKTLPGVAEAIEGGRYGEAQSQLAVLITALNSEAAYLLQVASNVPAR